jgi:hypothetical protein
MPAVSKQVIHTLAEQIAQQRAQLDQSLRALRQQYGNAAVERAQVLADQQRQRQDTIAVTPRLKEYRRHGE